jgi:rhomboid family GlyGly-CTERM serine protease
VSRGALAWCALAGALALAAVALAGVARERIDWQPALVLPAPWRLWSASFAHWSAWHLGANLAGCAAVGAFGAAARVPPRSSLAWLAAWPLGHALLALQPALTSYGGLSGVLHAGVAIAAWHLLRHDEMPRRRRLGQAVAFGLAVKLLFEAPWGAPTRLWPGWDFPVAPLAHATGALAGLACAIVADAAVRRWHR